MTIKEISIFTILIGTILLYFLTSCNNENINYYDKANDEIFIIKDKQNKSNIDSPSSEIIVNTVFYLDYNIILFDSLPTCFIHKKRFVCHELVENNYLPLFEYLKPEYFMKLDNSSEILKIINSDTLKIENVYIAYNHDTIRDSKYFNLKRELEEENIQVSTRRITEEELFILNSIFNKEVYQPDKLIWKRTLNVPNKELLISFINENKNVP